MLNRLTGGSLLLKTLTVGALTLLMLWPLAQVQQLVSERQTLEIEARETIARAWGGEQLVGGPVLSVPVERAVLGAPDAAGRRPTSWEPAPDIQILPASLRIEAQQDVETRRKGIYALATWRAPLVISGEFSRAAIERALLARGESERVWRERARLLVPISELRSLRAADRLEFGGRRLTASTGSVGGMPALALSDTGWESGDGERIAFRFEIELAGSERLHFLPLGAATEVRLQSSWPHPDFDGAFLPLERTITATGFDARWRVLQLNRSLPEAWRDGLLPEGALAGAAFGVRLFQPVDLYSRNYRATRYGILFIALTFLGFFAWEQLSRRVRLHPMQYLLVGLALAVFYLLLLALSEHLGFALAYGVAAAALVALIGFYVSGATGQRRAAAVIATGLAGCYGLLYTILLSQDYALLLGALLVFAALAALMIATRRLEWSGTSRSEPTP